MQASLKSLVRWLDAREFAIEEAANCEEAGRTDLDGVSGPP
jgi:hypothetical protein